MKKNINFEDSRSREELLADIYKLQRVNVKIPMKMKFLQNKLNHCNVRIDNTGTIIDETYAHNVVGLTKIGRKIEDLFVKTPEANEYFNGILKLNGRLVSAYEKVKELKWENVSLGLDKSNPFKEWIPSYEDDWTINGKSARTKLRKNKRNHYLTSPIKLIGPNDDFRISYNAQAFSAPCDLSIVVGGNWNVLEDARGSYYIPEDKGYCFSFGAFRNTETHIQICSKRIEAETTEYLIEPGKLHHCVAQRIGGMLRFTIDGNIALDHCDPLPLLGYELGYISIYTYATDQLFCDLKIQKRKTCLDDELIKDIENFRQIVLEVKNIPNSFVEAEYCDGAFFFHDVTKVVRAQRETANVLQQQLIREKSIEKIEVVGQLAGGTAHNFNNSLMIIQGLTQLIGMELEADSRSAGFSKKILHQCKVSAELVGQLLDFSNQRMLVLLPMDINKVIENVLAIIKNTFNPNIEIEHNICETTFSIKGDQSHLETVFLNLALNSRDAMPSGGKLKFVSSLTDLTQDFFDNNGYIGQAGKYICISISDTGEGMSKEVQEKVFEPFFTTKPEGKGTGLGLSSVYGTIKGHKGYIELLSEIGKGSQFDIYLPIIDKLVELDEVIDSKEEAVVHDKKTILVLDDEGLIGNILELAFSEVGYSVVKFLSSAEAVEYYKIHWSEIDLSILDIIMPGQNGIECFDEFQIINKNAKCIFVSGHHGEEKERVELAERRGVLSFVKKPFDLVEIRSIVSNYFSQI
ncbi:MAG: hypothetical protein COA79_19930 [Planctomycetota bacterium]|nr:MAG: hypothetical protein COA79_19930 [Planctomycetota bacterium]